MASIPTVEHRNQDATIYVGNLDSNCTEDILMELFAQVGPVRSCYMPKDKLTNHHNGYGFVEFLDTVDAEYAMTVMNMIKLYNKPIRVSKSALNDAEARNNVGANLFVGNLDPQEVTEQLLHDTFSVFGPLTRPPTIARDENGQSKGYAFVNFDNFQSSDTAIECMHEQYLGNRQIQVQYAMKKDSNGKVTNERHGSRAERMLAEAARKLNENSSSTGTRFRPFGAPGTGINNIPPPPSLVQPMGGVLPPPPPPPPPPPSTLLVTSSIPPPPPAVPSNIPPPPPPPPPPSF